ncbi:beta-lactamase family protein [Chloroflexi bacterium TSY]|nr:beta-lactamase family protein [Chloroflexi bacterium TSY]
MQLCEFVDTTRQKHNVPGVVVGILEQDESKAAGFGVTNVEHPLDVTDDTLFQIGSITKTYTGTLIMKLVEEGKMALDAPVRTYLPEFKVADPVASEMVTIQHLMTHTSGWVGDFFIDTGPGDDAIAKYVAAMADLEQLAPIGEVWSYNNAGFRVLGHVIEVITGQSYQDALREMVLEPLGLNNTFFDAGDVITRRFAAGHRDNEVARTWSRPRLAYPSGGITCSVHDLLAYAKFHLSDGTLADGKALLQNASIRKMQTPQVTVRKKEQWGLTWSVDETYDTRLVSHGGITMGQTARLTLAPDRDFAFAILTNADTGGSVIEDVSRWINRLYLAIESADDLQPMGASIEQLTPYIGKYSRFTMDVEIRMLEGRLIAQTIYKTGFPTENDPPPPPSPPAILDLIEEDRLILLDGPMKSSRGEFIRKADGTIGWLRMGGRIHKRVE